LEVVTYRKIIAPCYKQEAPPELEIVQARSTNFSKVNLTFGTAEIQLWKSRRLRNVVGQATNNGGITGPTNKKKNAEGIFVPLSFGEGLGVRSSQNRRKRVREHNIK
jgi:hypothetical protein